MRRVFVVDTSLALTCMLVAEIVQFGSQTSCTKLIILILVFQLRRLAETLRLRCALVFFRSDRHTPVFFLNAWNQSIAKDGGCSINIVFSYYHYVQSCSAPMHLMDLQSTPDPSFLHAMRPSTRPCRLILPFIFQTDRPSGSRSAALGPLRTPDISRSRP
jgi:hypothetical protein